MLDEMKCSSIFDTTVASNLMRQTYPHSCFCYTVNYRFSVAFTFQTMTFKLEM